MLGVWPLENLFSDLVGLLATGGGLWWQMTPFFSLPEFLAVCRPSVPVGLEGRAGEDVLWPGAWCASVGSMSFSPVVCFYPILPVVPGTLETPVWSSLDFGEVPEVCGWTGQSLLVLQAAEGSEGQASGIRWLALSKLHGQLGSRLSPAWEGLFWLDLEPLHRYLRSPTSCSGLCSGSKRASGSHLNH